jgi:hypothetical protein
MAKPQGLKSSLPWRGEVLDGRRGLSCSAAQPWRPEREQSFTQLFDMYLSVDMPTRGLDKPRNGAHPCACGERSLEARYLG